ncbi:MAG: CBS domain-containing protein [Pseudomonadales bacterium]
MLEPPRIRTAFSPFAFTVELEAPLAQARSLMVENKVQQLPVVSAGSLVGSISNKDIHLILSPELGYPDMNELLVQDAYVPNPYVVDIDEPLERVLLAMAQGRHECALVTHSDDLVGIFTYVDACRCCGEFLQKYREHELGG